MTNQKIIDVFSLLIKKYKTEQQSAPQPKKNKICFKIRTFQKAISIINLLKQILNQEMTLKK